MSSSEPPAGEGRDRPMRRRPARPGGPKPLGDGLDRLLADLGAPSRGAIDRLLEAWPEVVGPVLAEATRPLGVRDGRLVVEADDPAVASTVRWSTKALVDSIDRLVEPGAVREIDVRVARSRS